MDIKQFDCVTLRNGESGTIVDVWEPGRVFEFDPDDHGRLGPGDSLTYEILVDDIASVDWSSGEPAEYNRDSRIR